LVLVVLGQYQLQLAVKVRIQYLAQSLQLVEVVESLEVQPLLYLKQMAVQVAVVTEKVRYLTSRQQAMVIPRLHLQAKEVMVELALKVPEAVRVAVEVVLALPEVLEQLEAAVLVETVELEQQHQLAAHPLPILVAVVVRLVPEQVERVAQAVVAQAGKIHQTQTELLELQTLVAVVGVEEQPAAQAALV
jgi:hypothetical protein